MSYVWLPFVTEENGPCNIYMGLSVRDGTNSIPYADSCRITQLEGLLIVQPYHPMLFQQGGLPGPELIMQFWRGQLRAEDLPAKWEEYEAAASKQQKRLDKMLWKCYACERELKATSFGAQVADKWMFATHVLERVLRRGACRYCVDCMQQRRAVVGGAANGAATQLERIPCQGPLCQGKAQERHAFPAADMARMSRNRDYRGAVCTRCLKSPSARVKHAIQKSQLQYPCSKCNMQRPAAEFESQKLNDLIAHGTEYNAVCLLCDATQLDRFTKATYKCCACQLDLSTEHFSVARKKSHNTKALKCELCERPPCRACGTRPERPLTNQNEVVKSLADRAAYRCMACKYPPCSVCHVTSRPKEKKYLVDTMATWTCASCREKQ